MERWKCFRPRAVGRARQPDPVVRTLETTLTDAVVRKAWPTGIGESEGSLDTDARWHAQLLPFPFVVLQFNRLDLRHPGDDSVSGVGFGVRKVRVGDHRVASSKQQGQWNRSLFGLVDRSAI